MPIVKDKRLNVICFGNLPWSNMWKRTQSMIATLSRRDFINRVLFVNPWVWTSSPKMFLSAKQTGIAQDLLNYFLPINQMPKVWIYSPIHFVPLKNRLRISKKLENWLFLKTIDIWNSRVPYVLIINRFDWALHSILNDLLKNASLSIYDVSDDFVELFKDENTRQMCQKFIYEYISRVDVVLTVNEHLKKKYCELNNNIFVFRNGTNYDNFHRPNFKKIEFMEKIRSRATLIIGYTGTINSTRLDYKILDYIVNHRPEWHLVFIGDADNKFMKWQFRHQNVELHQLVAYDELPDYMNYFDVAIVPFQINEHTKGNDLLKLHDYLAASKPVVSTRIGGADDLEEVIKIADGPSDFFSAIEEVAINSLPGDLEKRRRAAFSNSWPKRIEKLENILLRELKIKYISGKQ